MAKAYSPVISHMTLRKALGLLGFLLPFILLIGALILEEDNIFQSSVSHYYYTGMRDVFVAIVASFGLFLYTYRGEDPKDDLLTNIAGVCAILVALLPTNKDGNCQLISCYIHFAAATLFFIILAYISYFIFTLSNKPIAERTIQKRQRNIVYKICGLVIASCILLLAIYFAFFQDSGKLPFNTVFWFESFSLLAFGISWLTKGEAIFGDK